jgi:hypothetical protein
MKHVNWVVVICRRIIEQLPRLPVSPATAEHPVAKNRAKLRGFWLPMSTPDDSGSMGYQWPGSRLTGDDMRRLRIMSNVTGLPGTELLHVAVGMMFEQTRAMMAEMLAIQERTGQPLTEILDELTVSPLLSRLDWDNDGIALAAESAALDASGGQSLAKKQRWLF